MLESYGTIFRVNLSSGEFKKEKVDPYDLYRFIGGEGLAAKIYFDEVSPEIKPFDPENRLIFATGPLTGALVPGGARTSVVGKGPYPYPEGFTTSNFGGEWGPQLRYAGCDILIIQGKASEPVYLWIKDGAVEIKSAKKVWGLKTFEAQDKIREEIDDKDAQIITIGPAGERLVRYACILHRSGHAAGQGGFGAVMGSKNLKAIAVRGTKGVAIARPKDLINLYEYLSNILTVQQITTDASPLYKAFRCVNAPVLEDLIPFIEKYKVRNTGCLSCARHCYVFLNVPGIGGGEMSCVQFFYAWLQLGVMQNVDENMFLAKQLADQYGLNDYELLQLIPYLLILHERNVISDEKSGIPVSKFPAGEFIETLLKKIANREDIGDVLAEGTWRFAESLGLLKEYLSMEGIDEKLALKFGPIAGWMGYGSGGRGYCAHYCPRDYIVHGLLWAMSNRDPISSCHEYVGLVEYSGLDYDKCQQFADIAWNSNGAVHPRGMPSYSKDEAKAAIICQNRSILKNMLTLCDWLYPIISTPHKNDYVGDPNVHSKIFTAVTGKETTEEELLKAAEKSFNVERAILVVEGRRREADTLPEYIFKYPHYWTGSPPLDKDKWEHLKDIYYELRGWDVKNGIPTKEKLEELDLKDITTKLEKMGIILS